MMTIGMTAARSQLRELAAKVRFQHEWIELTDNGKPAAVLISPEDAAEFRKLQQAELEREVAEAKRLQGDGPMVEMDLALSFEEFDEAMARRAEKIR